MRCALGRVRDLYEKWVEHASMVRALCLERGGPCGLSPLPPSPHIIYCTLPRTQVKRLFGSFGTVRYGWVLYNMQRTALCRSGMMERHTRRCDAFGPSLQMPSDLILDVVLFAWERPLGRQRVRPEDPQTVYPALPC